MKTVQSDTAKADLQRRLRRIEGQVRGVQRMVDEERDCREILQQMKAVRAALQNASLTFMRAYAEECLISGDLDRDQREALVEELIDLAGRGS